MRYVAKVHGHASIKRLMIYVCDAVYLFTYDIEEDGGGLGDEWYETLEDAFDSAREAFGVEREGWQEIPDPPEDCVHDWIAPARIVSREEGNPQSVRLEVLRDGEWVEVPIRKPQ